MLTPAHFSRCVLPAQCTRTAPLFLAPSPHAHCFSLCCIGPSSFLPPFRAFNVPLVIQMTDDEKFYWSLSKRTHRALLFFFLFMRQGTRCG